VRVLFGKYGVTEARRGPLPSLNGHSALHASGRSGRLGRQDRVDKLSHVAHLFQLIQLA